MRRSWIGWTVAAIVAVGLASLAYVFWFAGGSGEPTTDLTTPELSSTTTTAPSAVTSVPGTTVAEGAAKSFVIDQTQSTASFEIHEELRGSPNTVLGETDQVVGQVRFDPADLSTVELSDIVVNARTLQTDSGQRDRVIRGPIILNSANDEFELITLSNPVVQGLDGSAVIGEQVTFTVTGDLTVKGTTQPITFDVVVTMIDENTLEGSATTQVSRNDFGIGIPNVPIVANVSDDVTIGLEFVAVSG